MPLSCVAVLRIHGTLLPYGVQGITDLQEIPLLC